MGNCAGATAARDETTTAHVGSTTTDKDVVRIPRHPDNSDHAALERDVDRVKLQATFQVCVYYGYVYWYVRPSYHVCAYLYYSNEKSSFPDS
jgi:hypothetical protein